MFEITVRGDAEVMEEDHDGGMIEAWVTHVLDGVDCQDSFIEYLWCDDKIIEAALKEVVTGGILSFDFDSSKCLLFAETTYESSRELTEPELEALKEYTSGQWSDGIGEGFEQEPVCRNGVEYYISAWHQDQVATVTQKRVS